MYKLILRPAGGQVVCRLSDNATFIPGCGNKDDLKYQEWLSQGNTPVPADPPPVKQPSPNFGNDADDLETQLALAVQACRDYLADPSPTAAKDRAQLRKLTRITLALLKRVSV